MKILMIAPQPFFEPRGTPISVYQRLKGLSALGHQVDLLTFHVGQDVVIPGVRTHRLPRIPFINRVKVGPSWAKLFLDILLFCQAIQLLARNRYDVIHTHEEAAFFSIFLAAFFDTYHVYDMHSSLPHQLKAFQFADYWPVVKLFELLERWVLNTCDAVITIGPALETYVHKINPHQKVVTIDNLPLQLNGTNPAHSTAESLREKWGLHNGQLIVYTGTFEPYQNLKLLLASIKIVKEQNPEASLVLAGGTPEQIASLQAEAKKFGVEQSVVFPGRVSPDEAIVYLDLATILVSPRTDGTSVPLKLYSYLYSGRPIVATDLATHRQLLNDDIALLVAPTQKALADAISTLLRFPDRREALGRQALKFAQVHFDPATYMTNLDWLYSQLESGGSDTKKNAGTADIPPLGQEN